MKVIYSSEASPEQIRWGSCADPRGILTVGGVYEVEREDVHTWHTKLFLKGFNGGFNSVNFEPVGGSAEHEVFFSK